MSPYDMMVHEDGVAYDSVCFYSVGGQPLQPLGMFPKKTLSGKGNETRSTCPLRRLAITV